MTRRELLVLLPLLALYLAAWAFFPERPDDELGYVALAERLTQGEYVTGIDETLLNDDPSHPDLWFGPGLPVLLLPFAALDASLPVMRLSGPLLLFGAVLLFFVLARERWGSRVGLIATYGLGLYPPFLGLLPNLHSEVLATFLLVASMVAVSRHLRSGSRWWFLAGALSLAGLALTRVAFGWVLTITLVVLVLWWLGTRSRSTPRAAPIFAAALVLCIPWLAYTYAKTDRLFVWGNSGSLSLYWMTSPYEGDLGDWQRADWAISDPDLAPHRSFFESLRGLTIAEANARLERQAFRNILNHPVKYTENITANVSRMLFNSPYSRTEQQVNDVFYALPNALVVGAIALCLAVLLPRRRTLPAETSSYVALAAVGFGLHTTVAAYPRLVMPLLPLVAWLATLALVEVGVLKRVAAQPERAPTESS